MPLDDQKKDDAIARATADAPDTGEYGRASFATFYRAAWDDSESNPDFQFPKSITMFDRMRSEPVIQGLLHCLGLPILQAEWGISAGDDTHAGQEAAARLEENLRTGLEWTGESGIRHTQNFDDVIRNALLMLVYGFAVDEHVWDFDARGVRLAKLAPRLPRTVYRFLTSESNASDLIGIEQQVHIWGRPTSPTVYPVIPASKVTLYVFNREADSFVGRSLLRALYRPWWLKDGLWRVIAMTAERTGMGIPQLYADAATRPLDDNAYKRAMEIVTRLRAGESSGFVNQPGWKLDITGQTGQTPDLVTYAQYADRSMAIAAVQTVLTAGIDGSGSFAQAQEHGDTSVRMVRSIATQIEQAFNSSWVRAWHGWNYGNACRCPEFRFSDVTMPTIGQIADILMKLAGAGVLTPDQDIEEYVRKELGLPKKAAPPTATAGKFAVTPGTAPWGRPLTKWERYIALADIEAGQNRAIADLSRTMLARVPEFVSEAAVRLASVPEDKIRSVSLKADRKFLTAIATNLERAREFSEGHARDELARLGRGQTVSASSVPAREMLVAATPPRPGTRLWQMAVGLFELLANDILSRMSAETLRRRIAGFNGSIDALAQAVVAWFGENVNAEGFISTIASGGVINVFSEERDKVFEAAGIKRWGYSSVLDRKTCRVCERADGKEGRFDQIPPAPNPKCEGGVMRCRCIHYAVLEEEDD